MNLSETRCPSCHQDYAGLSIESSRELGISRIKCSECTWDYSDEVDEETLIEQFSKLKFADHNSWLGVNYDDVKIGQTVDMEAGLFLKRTNDGWLQIDGGYSVQVSDDEVRTWLKEREPSS